MNDQGPIVITRYPSRKCYTTDKRVLPLSGWISLSDVTTIAKLPHGLKIVCSRTKLDVTAQVLRKALVENERVRESALSVEQLTHLIRVGGGTFTGFLTNVGAI